jgi:predicted GIY-YIG superfamily endonuclease
MHRSRSNALVIRDRAAVRLANVVRTTAIAVAMASFSSLAQANTMDQTIFPEETPDRIVTDQVVSVDAFGYLGGLFEARFYETHSTTDDPRDEIRQAASLYGVDLAMIMSIAKVESDFNPRARTGSYKGLFQLSDYEFQKYGDGNILDARDNARAAAHMFLVQAEKFRWALGHYPDYAQRYMVHQQGIQGAVEHYKQPERVAWQSMCATDEGMMKGEQWCKKCIWGNLLPQWKHDFGSVEKITSGDFVSLWTERINHLANRYDVAQGGASISPPPKTHARRPNAVARYNIRAPRPPAPHLRAPVASAGPARPLLSSATTSPRNSGRTAQVPAKPSQAVATAAGRTTAGSERAQRRVAAVSR